MPERAKAREIIGCVSILSSPIHSFDANVQEQRRRTTYNHRNAMHNILTGRIALQYTLK